MPLRSLTLFDWNLHLQSLQCENYFLPISTIISSISMLLHFYKVRIWNLVTHIFLSLGLLFKDLSLGIFFSVLLWKCEVHFLGTLTSILNSRPSRKCKITTEKRSVVGLKHAVSACLRFWESLIVGLLQSYICWWIGNVSLHRSIIKSPLIKYMRLVVSIWWLYIHFIIVKL